MKIRSRRSARRAGRRVLAAAVLGILLAAVPAGAQPDVEVRRTPPRPELPGVRPDAHTVQPGDAGHPFPGPYAPLFIGPTIKSETGEFGLSMWVAPNTPLNPETGWKEVSGWAAIGVTFTWGDHRLPHSPEH